jgi:hypothetical protein
MLEGCWVRVVLLLAPMGASSKAVKRWPGQSFFRCKTDVEIAWKPIEFVLQSDGKELAGSVSV